MPAIDPLPSALLTAAVQSYNAAARAPKHGRGVISSRLDGLLDLAERWSETDLAGCLLVLILARRADGGLSRCAQALGHVLAELQIPLPLDGDAVMAADGDPIIPFVNDERSDS